MQREELDNLVWGKLSYFHFQVNQAWYGFLTAGKQLTRRWAKNQVTKEIRTQGNLNTSPGPEVIRTPGKDNDGVGFLVRLFHTKHERIGGTIIGKGPSVFIPWMKERLVGLGTPRLWDKPTLKLYSS